MALDQISSFSGKVGRLPASIPGNNHRVYAKLIILLFYAEGDFNILSVIP